MAARRRNKDRPPAGRQGAARRVYVETSVWGMTLDNQPRALRQPTQEFLRQCGSGLFLPYISTVVLQEIDRAAEPAPARMVREIDKLAPTTLKPGDKSEELAEAYLLAGVVPAKKRDDAATWP